MAAAGPNILFSGCSVEHDRTPVRAAVLALAATLRLNLAETSLTLCCGARAGRGVGTPDARHLLAPLLAAAQEGQSIVCLSPSCRNALTTHLVDLARDAQGSPADMLRHPIEVLDFTEFLARTGAVTARLQEMPSTMSGSRVALHSVCHGDHNPASWPSGRVLSIEFPRGGTMTFSLKGTEEADSALTALVTAAGASVVEDVSLSSQCVHASMPGGQPGSSNGSYAPLSCLAAAARAGAEAIITPCVLCYSDLTRFQQTLDRHEPAAGIPVVHLAQFAGMACAVPFARLGLKRNNASARQLLKPVSA